ncbi:hypothetical protein HWV62_31821 [Athelia sp. TMB]|nr:hypothetical protein HWV62_31821 [Athelia sp. TMB]
MNYQLDDFYDFAAASASIVVTYAPLLSVYLEQKLDQLIQERVGGKQGHKQLLSFTENGDVTYSLIHSEGPRSARLAVREGSLEVEEAVLRVQGIICKAILPPRRKQIRRSGDQNTVRYLQQSFTLTGCGSQTFQSATESAYAIAEMFSRQEDDMMPWAPATFQDGPALETSNRLFTYQGRNGRHVPVNINRNLDPHGSLSRLAGTEFVHTEDNTVQYFKGTHLQTGGISYKTADPATFKPGDIVEAQCSFIMLPNRGGHHSMKVIIRALTMLDDKYSKEANITRMKAGVMLPATICQSGASLPARRKVGYEADDEKEDIIENVNKGVKKMRVDEGDRDHKMQ